MHTLSETLPKERKKYSMKNSMKQRIRKYITLILSFLLVYLFVSEGMPALSKLAGPTFQASHQIIIEEDIPAGEWFYIFVPQIRDIEPRVRNTLKYTPGMHAAD